jgi:hypothetical protein
VAEVEEEGWKQTYPVGGQFQQRLFALRDNGPSYVIEELDLQSGNVINNFPLPAQISFSGFGLQGLATGAESLFYVDGSAFPPVLWELDADTGRVIDSDPQPRHAV